MDKGYSQGMENEPSTYKAGIEFSYQQMVEMHKALTSRIYVLSTEDTEGFSYEDNLRWLHQAIELLDFHINVATLEWEAGIAETEATKLTDKALREWLDEKGE